jgi:hypothetical protein
MDRKTLRNKWLWQGGLGAALLGFGSCCVVESGFLKHNGAPIWQWTLFGTLSLCILISGVVLLIKAGFLGEALKNAEHQNGSPKE